MTFDTSNSQLHEKENEYVFGIVIILRVLTIMNKLVIKKNNHEYTLRINTKVVNIHIAIYSLFIFFQNTDI